jgi:anti-anti-sigma factor
MSNHYLRASIRSQSGIAIIDLHGDIDGDAEAVLKRAFSNAEARDPVVILLNFANVHYMNSKGIALAVVLLKEAIRSRRGLLACSLSEHYRQIFAITRLADYISVYEDVQSALSEVEKLELDPQT